MVSQDPIVEEVRKARDEHAARFEYDLKRIFEHLKEQERTSGREYVTLPPKRPGSLLRGQ
jgi:hypothetical protein